MTKLQFGKLNYVVEEPRLWNNGLHIEFNEEIPTEVYKYFSPTKHSLQALATNKLFCSHPYHFNDLTDSNALSFDFRNLQYDDYRKIYDDADQDPATTEKNYQTDKLTGFKVYRFHAYSLITQKIGIICVSKNEMHNLMWGHYASDAGFKVKFDSTKLINSINQLNDQNCLFFPVNYVKHKQHIDVNEMGIHFPLLVDLSTKVFHWEYENEWRIIITKNDMDVPNSYVTSVAPDHIGAEVRLVDYNPDAILEIVLGMHFFNGKNVENFEAISKDEIWFTIKNPDFALFLKFVSDLPGKIFHSGLQMDYANNENHATVPMHRSIQSIEINEVRKNVFSMIKKGDTATKIFYNLQ